MLLTADLGEACPVGVAAPSTVESAGSVSSDFVMSAEDWKGTDGDFCLPERKFRTESWMREEIIIMKIVKPGRHRPVLPPRWHRQRQAPERPTSEAGRSRSGLGMHRASVGN